MDLGITYVPSTKNKVIAVCDVWLIDGTFKMCPPQFTQVYTIHGMYMGQVVPFVYCFLPSKKEKHYVQMFEAIRGAGDPAYIVCDFEIAAIKACKSVYNISTSMYGCLFHLSRKT